MSAAEKIAPMITEPLTWSQICERYPDQWVCVVEIEWDEPRKFHLRAARVVGHGTKRRESLVQARPWWDHYQEIGRYYTGKIVAPFPRFPANFNYEIWSEEGRIVVDEIENRRQFR